MTQFRIVAHVECDTPAQADVVAGERFGYDEQYDDPETDEPFDYTIDSFVVEPVGLLEQLRPHVENVYLTAAGDAYTPADLLHGEVGLHVVYSVGFNREFAGPTLDDCLRQALARVRRVSEMAAKAR